MSFNSFNVDPHISLYPTEMHIFVFQFHYCGFYIVAYEACLSGEEFAINFYMY